TNAGQDHECGPSQMATDGLSGSPKPQVAGSIPVPPATTYPEMKRLRARLLEAACAFFGVATPTDVDTPVPRRGAGTGIGTRLHAFPRAVAAHWSATWSGVSCTSLTQGTCGCRQRCDRTKGRCARGTFTEMGQKAASFT